MTCKCKNKMVMFKEKGAFYLVCFVIFRFFSNFASCLGTVPSKECLVNLLKNKNYEREKE